MMKIMTWKLFPNNSRVFIGGWIIAAISILSFNLEKLGDLQYSPMVENSPLVNTIRLKHYHFEQVLSERKADLDISWDRPVLLTNLTKPPVLPKPVSGEAQKEDPPLVDRAVQLPKLSGILMVGGNSSKSRYSAVLNGKFGERKFLRVQNSGNFLYRCLAVAKQEELVYPCSRSLLLSRTAKIVLKARTIYV
jgi:hypothetical protein